MKNVQKIDLGLTGYDELFMNDAERKENKLPRIYDVPISEIDDFPDHPFKVKIDEDMDQLVQSIKERGIITPVTLRPKEDGRYEIVSGHRRKKACELAGLDTVKAEVREMTRDEAIILMVESNLQRSTILPSEKAFSYSHDVDIILNDETITGVLLDAYIPESRLAFVVIDRGTKTERDTFTVADHLCKVRGIKCVCISARNDPEIICVLIKKALRSIHIYITSDNMADIETARRRFEQWRKQR